MLPSWMVLFCKNWDFTEKPAQILQLCTWTTLEDLALVRLSNGNSLHSICASGILVRSQTVLWGSSENDYRKDRKKKKDSETKVRNWEGCPVSIVAASSLILLGSIYFTVSWETKSQASRDNGWCIFDICIHLETSLFLLIPSPKMNRTRSPLPWASSISALILLCVSRPGNPSADPGLTWLFLTGRLSQKQAKWLPTLCYLTKKMVLPSFL